jgi:hypothetical protein
LVQRIYRDPRGHLRIVVKTEWMPRLVTVGWQRIGKSIIHKELLVSWGCREKPWCRIYNIKRCPRLRSVTIGAAKCAGEAVSPD